MSRAKKSTARAAGNKMPKNKGGRPRKPPGEKYLTPPRQIGRWTDEDWELVKSAAEKEGKTITDWAKAILLRNARRVLNK